MNKLFGHKTGLKPGQIHRLKNLYRRRVPSDNIIAPSLSRDICLLSHDIRRQIGLLINRSGKVAFVIIGTAEGIVIPETRGYRLSPGRLRGLRCVHTHLSGEKLSRDDLTDLSLLRLDVMAAVTMDSNGHPLTIHAAHVLPDPEEGVPWRTLAPYPATQPNTGTGCRDLIRALEDEMARRTARIRPGDHAKKDGKAKERALLVSVPVHAGHDAAKDRLTELAALADSAGLFVVESVIQRRRRRDPRLVMGKGKLRELTIFAMQKEVTLLVFDRELSPSRIRSIADTIELKVIDRTQLILDIFAQRARTREGKLQVELAQLKYLLPRLVIKNTAMSRLTGGIGGRGPGETKLEISRRRVRQRIGRLEKDLRGVQAHRSRQRAMRKRRNLPVISIVGYTNAGKSTLLNTLTQSRVPAESRLFATLDPSSRRLRFPRDMEVIITDTVGFIRDLPKELMAAFRATLEELDSADLLLHVIDAANPAHMAQVASVEGILHDLSLDHIPEIRVLNKMDRIPRQTADHLARTLNGIPVSARHRPSLMPLIKQMEKRIRNVVTGQ